MASPGASNDSLGLDALYSTTSDYSSHLLPDEALTESEREALATTTASPIKLKARAVAMARASVHDSKGLLREALMHDNSMLTSRVFVLSVPLDANALAGKPKQQRIDARDLKRIKEIGRGAFGTVWYGEYCGKPVAVKQARGGDGDAELVEEAGQLAALPPHNNVLRLFGVCMEPVCIVTEYCSRGSLNELLYGSKVDDNMSGSTLDRCVVDAALGLYHLHANGVVHRDIASRNILVDDGYRAKVADFGMARVADELEGDYTVSTTGPLKWMAPEQLERRKVRRIDTHTHSLLCLFCQYISLTELGFFFLSICL